VAMILPFGGGDQRGARSFRYTQQDVVDEDRPRSTTRPLSLDPPMSRAGAGSIR
jgi:hypothetical protein